MYIISKLLQPITHPQSHTPPIPHSPLAWWLKIWDIDAKNNLCSLFSEILTRSDPEVRNKRGKWYHDCRIAPHDTTKTHLLIEALTLSLCFPCHTHHSQQLVSLWLLRTSLCLISVLVVQTEKKNSLWHHCQPGPVTVSLFTLKTLNLSTLCRFY